MTTPWAHLPNAAHIDRIIAHIRSNPEAWTTAWDAARDAVGEAAIVAAWDAAWDAAGETPGEFGVYIRDEVVKWERVTRAAAWGAILSLIAWDHVGGLLDLPKEQVQVLSLLGQPAALLMLPAVIALDQVKEMA